MSHPAIVTEERYIELWRDTHILQAGQGYVPGETLEVRLSSSQGQYVLEVLPSPPIAFVNGTCGGRRFLKDGGVRSPWKPTYIEIPVDFSGELRILGGWAEGYDVVKITPTLTLKPAASNEGDL